MKQNRQRGKHYVLPFFLCLCMLFTMPGIQNVFPVVAAAEQEESFQKENIIMEFYPLSEDVKEQTVFTGTDLDELDLPKELTVSLLWESSEQKTEESEQESTGQEDTGESDDIGENSDTETGDEQDIQSEEDGESEEVDESTETDNEDVADSENDESDEGESASSEGQEETVTIRGITWQSEPEYDGSTEGTYTFTAVLPDGYTMAEGVSLPKITVAVESGIDAIIQILLDRIAALPEVEEYLASEPCMEEDENAYTEWKEKLYEYAEEALAIWEEYEALTEEQQAQIPEGELAKLEAWMEIAETFSGHAVMLADDSEHHGESDWTALSVNDTTLSDGKLYMSDENGDLTMGTITIDGDVTLCLNGHKLQHDSTDGSVIEVVSGTFTLCDCQDDYTYSWNGSKENPVYTLEGSGGCITGGNGRNSLGGGVYVCSNATFNMNSGRITGCDVEHVQGHWGGGVYVEAGATFEMTGGFIENNAAAIGGGVYVCGSFIMSDEAVIMNNNVGASGAGVAYESKEDNIIRGGKILGNTAGGLGGGIRCAGEGATLIIEGGLIEGNSAGSGGGGLHVPAQATVVLSGGTIRYNRMPADTSISIDAGGVRLSTRASTLKLSGSISIYDNYFKDGSISNVYLPRDASVTITGALSNPVGITSLTKPPNGTGDAGAVVVANGDGYTIKDTDWNCIISDEEYKVIWNETDNQILLEEFGNCDLEGLNLTAEGAKLEPNFQADIITYTATVGNDVEKVGITATLAGTTDGKTIKIKNGTVLPETDMTSGVKEEVPLAVGLNTIEITVTSGSETKTYTIEITREAPVSYTITYNLDGGTATGNPESYTSSDDTVTLNNPTKEGYTFTGWSGTELDGENNMAVTISKGSTGDREYTAHWKAKEYSVKLNGSNGIGTDITGYTYGTGAALPTDWTKTGYTFDGWYDNERFAGTAVTDISVTDTGDKEYWAKWTANTYQVTFDYHGADGGNTTQNKDVTYDSTYGALPIPTRTGYAFKGWYTEENGQGSKVDVGTTVKATSAHTLHAYWKDETAPDQPVLQDDVTLPADWTNTQDTIPLKLYDGVGVTELWVSVDGKDYIKVDGFTPGTGSMTYEYTSVLEGEHTYQFKAVDAADNVSEESAVFTVKLDQTKPVIGTITYENKAANLWDWIIGKTSMIVHVPVTDTGSGVAKISYTLTPRDAAGNLDSSSAVEKTAAVSGGEAKIVFDADFRGTITINCTDAAGNQADGVIIGKDAGGVIVEDHAPVITIQADRNISDTQQTQPGGVDVSEAYYNSAPALLVTVKDDTGNAITAGIATVTYRIGNGDVKSVSVNTNALQTEVFFTILAAEIPTGSTNITITTTDNAGNPAEEIITIKVKGPEKQPAAEIDYRQEELTGLVPEGEYLIEGETYTADQEGHIPIKEDWLDSSLSIVKKGNNSETSDSLAQSLSVPARPAAPGAPELSTRTENSITLKTITGAQYRRADGTENWQDSTIFEGLNPKTAYSFRAYYPATDTSFASKESGAAEIATVPTPPTPDKLGIDYDHETLTPAGDIEAFSDAGCTTPVTAGSAEDYMGTTVYIRYQAEGIIPASATTPVSVPERTSTPTPGTTDASYPGAADGKLTGLTADGSYMLSLDGGNTWESRTANESGEITGLKAGTYELYVAAGSTKFRSETATVTVGEKPATKYDMPDIQIDYDNRTLTGFESGGTYLINGQEVSVRQDGTIEIDAGWFGTTLSIIRKGNGKDKTDSDAQSLFVPTIPPKPTPTGVDVSTAGGTGKLTGLTAGTTYEISTDGGRTWKTQPQTANGSGEITGLEPGTYTVRVKAGVSNFASEPSEPATIGAYKVTVTFMVDGAIYKEISVDYGTTLTDIPSVPIKNGKVGDWCVNAQGSSLAEFTNITADMTVYAVYTTAYTVTLQGGTGYTLSAVNDSKSPVKEGGSFTFRFELKEGYHRVSGSFAVTVNGAKVELTNDTYTITDIREDQTVAVAGVEKDADNPSSGGGDDGGGSEPTPTPTPQPTDTPTPTPQPPSPINPPEQPQPTEKPDDKPETVSSTPDNSQPGDKQEPESTGTPKPTEQTVPATVDNRKIVISGEPVATGNVKGMTDTRTVLEVGNGAVIVTIVCTEQEYTAGVADTLAVANAVLAPEQIELVNNGETIEIRIDVKDISEQVPERDKEIIENSISEFQKEVPGLTLGMYVDISMFIRIGEGDWNAITTTKEPIEVIIGIPEKLQEKGRAYYIIRAHEGVSTFMNDMDDEPSTITVSTDLFSSYAIAYVQAEGTGHKCGLCHICPTFLGICYFIWLAIIIALILISWIVIRRNSRKQDEQES